MKITERKRRWARPPNPAIVELVQKLKACGPDQSVVMTYQEIRERFGWTTPLELSLRSRLTQNIARSIKGQARVHTHHAGDSLEIWLSPLIQGARKVG